jgi:uncharacterized membrane protein YhdT
MTILKLFLLAITQPFALAIITGLFMIGWDIAFHPDQETPGERLEFALAFFGACLVCVLLDFVFVRWILL